MGGTCAPPPHPAESMKHIDCVNCNTIVTVYFTTIHLIILPQRYLVLNMVIFKYGENLTKVLAQG